MRSLVTGVAGFIGSHVADELLKLGHTVLGIDDYSGGFHENLMPHVTCWGGDITKPDVVKEMFGYGPFDYVFHCAAYAAEGLSHFIRRYNYANNLIGSVNLINAAVNQQPMVKRFVFLSSIAVYGDAQPPFREADIPRPIDPYGIAKWAVEMDLAAASRMFGLDFTIFRLHNVYGERQNVGDPYRNVIGIFMNKILRGEPLPIFGDGQQVRAFTYIGDVAPEIAASADDRRAANETFNLGSDTSCTVFDLACKVMITMLGRADHPLECLPHREEAREAYCDHSKAKWLLHTDCTTTLEDGLARMAKWVHGQKLRQSKPFEGIEVELHLPPSWKKVIA